MDTYYTTKRLFKRAIQEILLDVNNDKTKESALPAYAHNNPIIDYIFWKRLDVAIRQCASIPNASVLDFGCGTGLMSHALGSIGCKVTATDIEFEPLDLIRRKVSFPPSVTFINGDIIELDLPQQSFDIIIALDVLEHVSDIGSYASHFKKLIKQDGFIVISGPTENFLYKLGRKFAGRDFTGAYHKSNIYSIEEVFNEHFEVNTVARIVWPLDLFEVLVCKPRKDNR